MIPRIYVDTSVIGGCFDPEFKGDSQRLFEQAVSRKKIIIVSDVVLFELEEAPARVRNLLASLPKHAVEYVALNEEAIELASAYLRASVVAENSLSDARHIAIATVQRVDLMVSWNFKHIVNIRRISLFNSVNLKLGYPLIEIRSPEEIVDDNEKH